MSLDHDDAGTVPGFQVVLADPEGQFAGFKGTICVNGSAIETASLLDELGEYFWLDRGDDELIYFFEFRTHEIQIEQSQSRQIQRVIVTNDALMADPEQRLAYRVDKSWPPF
ncbi:MAG: hypothetical protein AAFX06_16545 [Planctomycetota bacterium]